MKPNFLLLVTAVFLAACSGPASDTAEPGDLTHEQICMTHPDNDGGLKEITAGLNAKIVHNGYGRSARNGDLAEVHYTGWLYDKDAENNRTSKFDSSVDRNEPFAFTVGAGQVIKGWDLGVRCMLIGEKRELIIAPELAYGERGAGNVIPPGATLLFEVELLRLAGDDEQEQ